MRLRRLAAEGFRNLAATSQDISAQFVVLEGQNAQGKTNALEAIHLVATLKPLRGRRLSQLIRWGSSSAAVAAWVEHQGVERHHRIDLSERGRSVKLDSKRVTDLQEYFAGVRAIAFTPTDGRIIEGEPARRRNWLDRAAFTAAPAHLGRARAYRQALQQKLALLRSRAADTELLDVLDDQLATLGAVLVFHRERMLSELRPHVEQLHDSIAGGIGQVTLTYATGAQGATLEERRETLRERLHAARPRELARATTLVGPQLDDVKVAIEGQPAREFASRGQIRSLVLALKLAEMLAARERGDVPLFLIDDASTELDGARTGRLVRLLAELGAQVFATTTDAAPLRSALPDEDTQLIKVKAGQLTEAGAIAQEPPRGGQFEAQRPPDGLSEG